MSRSLKSITLITLLALLNLSQRAYSYRGQYAIPQSEIPRTLEEYTETTVTTDENGETTTETTTTITNEEIAQDGSSSPSSSHPSTASTAQTQQSPSSSQQQTQPSPSNQTTTSTQQQQQYQQAPQTQQQDVEASQNNPEGEDSSASPATYRPSQSANTQQIQNKTTISQVVSDDARLDQNFNQDDDGSDADQASEEMLQKQKRAAKKRIYNPELSLVDPKPRTYSNSSMVNLPPCGGSDKGFVHYMATPGSRNFIQWKVSHPAAEGNCTVRVGQGLDEDEFVVLRPRDGSAYKDGSFPCGREVGYEGKEFRFPRNYTCDQCTLQLEWTIPAGQIHQCADFIMTSRDAEECTGKCVNGGACINGECRCRAGFYGTYCESKNQVSSRIIWYVLIFVIMIAVIIGIVAYTLNERKKIRRNVDDDQNSIIGSNPEPSKKGSYGR